MALRATETALSPSQGSKAHFSETFEKLNTPESPGNGDRA